MTGRERPMAYRISVRTRATVKPDAAQESTTRVSVTGDTAEEAEQICRVLDTLRGFGGDQPRGIVIEGVGGSNKALPEGTPDPLAPPLEQAPTEDFLSLSNALASYLAVAAAGGMAPSTLRSYGYILRKFVRTIGPSRCIQAIREADISTYLVTLRATCKPSYPSLVGRIIKRFFDWLVERGDVRRTPMAGIKLRVPPPNPVPPFSDAEIHRLFEAATTPMERAIVTLLLDTGMRASELCNLTWADLDLDQGIIRILGKGSKIRHVALNRQPREALAAYAGQGHQNGKRLWPPGLNHQTLHMRVQRLGKRANVPHAFPHRFRHTFASGFLRETGDAMALKALLGHESLVMVHRYTVAAEAELAVAAHKEHSPTAKLQEARGQSGR